MLYGLRYLSWGDYLQLSKISIFFSRGFVFRTSTGMSSSLEPLSRDKGLFCSFWEVFYELYGKFMMMIDVFVSLFWELNKVVLSSTIAL